jgi:3-oxoacyl-[acyl-carrier-protein] synthase-1
MLVFQARSPFLLGKRLINSGDFDHAVVAGADTISKFILSGFQSFQAISSAACKPFDKNRAGINLGDGAGTIILSGNPELSSGIKISGGSTSNDANHISGTVKDRGGTLPGHSEFNRRCRHWC